MRWFYRLSFIKRFLKEANIVIGLDNFNDYYDVRLKEARINNLKKFADNNNKKFVLIKGDIKEKSVLNNLFNTYKPDYVVNLAAQAGVRNSIENPDEYVQTNLVGFLNILESCRDHPVKHLIYASSSSVYGGNTKMPFSENQSVDHPISLYAATKRSNELLAHSYSHLFSIPATGLRFFTVYGPWEDLIWPFSFYKINNQRGTNKSFNHGKMNRDFTFIDDIIESIIRISKKPPFINTTFDTSNPSSGDSWAPHQIFNIGNSKSESLGDYIKAIEDALGKKAEKIFLPMQPGDVPSTASIVQN